MATSPIGSAASPSLNSDGATPPLRTKPPVVSPTPAPAADVIGQRGDRDAGGQGTAAYTAAVLGHNGTVRAQYHHEVGALRANPNTQSSEARSQIRAKYQAKSTPLAQALAKHIASSPGRLERLQQKSPAQLTVSASRSNGPIDSLGRAARIAGRGGRGGGPGERRLRYRDEPRCRSSTRRCRKRRCDARRTWGGRRVRSDRGCDRAAGSGRRRTRYGSDRCRRMLGNRRQHRGGYRRPAFRPCRPYGAEYTTGIRT